jgi:hypothetical protein
MTIEQEKILSFLNFFGAVREKGINAERPHAPQTVTFAEGKGGVYNGRSWSGVPAP